MKDLIMGILLGALIMLGGLLWTDKVKAEEVLLSGNYIAVVGESEPEAGYVYGNVIHKSLPHLTNLIDIIVNNNELEARAYFDLMLQTGVSVHIAEQQIQVHGCTPFQGYTICKIS